MVTECLFCADYSRFIVTRKRILHLDCEWFCKSQRYPSRQAGRRYCQRNMKYRHTERARLRALCRMFLASDGDALVGASGLRASLY